MQKPYSFIFIFASLVVLFISISGCDKENVPDQSQETIYQIPEAYPGIDGEIVEFIINGDTIICEKIYNKYIWQGDMILTEYQVLHSDTSRGAGLPFGTMKWPNNKVFYELDDNFPNPSRVTDAIEHIQAKTNVSFVKRTDQSQTNYIKFVSDIDGSYSNLGMIEGGQEIHIADAAWMTTGSVIHEIGHALGLIHEHSRHDRNNYIVIKWLNIKPNKWSQFYKRSSQYMTANFDTNSIMLYPSINSFAIDITKPTLTRMDGTIIKGQQLILSEGDVEVINMIYAEGQNIDLPTVTSIAPINITETTATVGGKVTYDGGSNVLERGVYWGTSENPEQSGNKLTIGIGLGSFSTNLSGLLANETYFLKAYATNSKGTAYGNQVVFTTSITFSVGQSYGGGIIFYVDGTGEHGLIAAATDQSTSISWYNGNFVETGATATAIGKGMSNTQKIVLALGLGNYAAKICDQLVLDGFNDWFLPSKNELDALFDLQGTGSLGSNDYYWASTESGGSGYGSGAWAQSKYFGGYNGAYATAAVRAIRSF
jgi:hypothetical protein